MPSHAGKLRPLPEYPALLPSGHYIYMASPTTEEASHLSLAYFPLGSVSLQNCSLWASSTKQNTHAATQQPLLNCSLLFWDTSKPRHSREQFCSHCSIAPCCFAIPPSRATPPSARPMPSRHHISMESPPTVAYHWHGGLPSATPLHIAWGSFLLATRLPLQERSPGAAQCILPLRIRNLDRV